MLGQDALGRWAWMVVDMHSRMIGSGDDFYDGKDAADAGVEFIKSKQRELDKVR